MNKLKELFLDMRWLYTLTLIAIAIGIMVRMGSAHAATMGVDAQKLLSKNTQCFALEITHDMLTTLGEKVVGVGEIAVQGGSLPLIFYEAEDEGTWTILMIFPRHGMNGEHIACIHSFGDKRDKDA